MRRIVAGFGMLSIIMFMGACGGDSTGPIVDVTGTWTFSMSNLSGNGISCSVGGTTATITQSGQNFSGSYAGGTITCVGGGESFSAEISTGTILNGVISDHNVTFDLDTPDAPFRGTINGDSMSGTGTFSVDTGEPTGVIVLSGQWGAVRQ